MVSIVKQKTHLTGHSVPWLMEALNHLRALQFLILLIRNSGACQLVFRFEKDLKGQVQHCGYIRNSLKRSLGKIFKGIAIPGTSGKTT